MYYLFLTKQEDLNRFKTEFFRVKQNIDAGKTPVFNEMRSAKTNLIEAIPFLTIAGVFLICSTKLLDALELNETLKIAVILVVNGFCNSISNFLFTVIKHKLRLKLLERLQIEPTERNIAVLESLEYQSV